jgi:FkbM family methyltransferase
VSRIPQVAVRLYEAAAKILPMHRQPFRSLYSAAYFAYKRYEDPLASFLRGHPALLDDGNVIDAGANIGYTTLLFASGVPSPFFVHAFEPEPMNADLLERNVRRSRFADRVIIHRAAVGAGTGRAQLAVNLGHPGDHRVITASSPPADRFVDVNVVAIDEVISDQPVSLVKLDVQGFELEASRGMDRTLERNPTISVVLEYAPEALSSLGFDPAALIAFYRQRNFEMWIIDRGRLRTFTAELPLRASYVNILCRRAGV